MAICRVDFSVVQYAKYLDLPSKLWWKVTVLNFSEVYETITEIHGKVHLWLYVS
jgi:hypothetical protein